MGDCLYVVVLCNYFMLCEDVVCYCFVVGGIGIILIFLMVCWCQVQGKDWCLLYVVCECQCVVFFVELMMFGGEWMWLYCSDEGDLFDSIVLIVGLGVDEEFYCCGFDGLMQVICDVGSGCVECLYFECFDVLVVLVFLFGGIDVFCLELCCSVLSLCVESYQSIFEVFEEQGLEFFYVCCVGICRICEICVCVGELEYFDYVFFDIEWVSGEILLICVLCCCGNYLEFDF